MPVNHSHSLSEVVAAIANSERRNKHCQIIAVDGPAGAGKSTLANRIAQSFSDLPSLVIHMDDLYDGWENALTPALTKVLEGSIAKPVSEGKAFEYRKYDWLLSKFGDLQRFNPPKLLILEGVGSGQKTVRKYLDQLIWIDIQSEVGINRVLRRDGDYLENHMRIWQFRESEHFQSDNTRDCATIRIDGSKFI